MWPTFSTMYEKSFKPLSQGEIGIEQAYEQAETPLRMFMYSQMSEDTSYIKMFMNMAKLEKPNTLKDVPTYILVPSYILHELTVAFKIGVLLYIPFIIIDMIVASILMSMGMMMLPPVQISMPFKLILFVLIDGWGLLTQQLFISVIK
jgi:flagellar biosynthetic protein FliP